jgi:hypothetical protein
MKPKRNKKSSASPRASADTSLPYRLTASEIESLRKDLQDASKEMDELLADVEPLTRPTASNPPPKDKANTSLPYRLTPAEIEALRQDKKETMAWAMKRFAHLKPIQRTNQG